MTMIPIIIKKLTSGGKGLSSCLRAIRKVYRIIYVLNKESCGIGIIVWIPACAGMTREEREMTLRQAPHFAKASRGRQNKREWFSPLPFTK